MDKITFEENVINEIVDCIRDNINVYMRFSDEYFTKIKKYCNDNYNKDYKSIPYGELILFTEEVLYELFNCYHLYDLRSLE